MKNTMKESIGLSLLRAEPKDSDFKEKVFKIQKNETTNEHLQRMLDALRLEVVIDQEGLEHKMEHADIIVSNHPTSLDIFFITRLLGTRRYVVITQHKRVLSLKRFFGDDAICPVPLNKEQISDFLVVAKDSLFKGKKIIFFPSGGHEIKGGDGEWLSSYVDLLGLDIFDGKSVLPFAIDAQVGSEIQKQVGDTVHGTEILPELHYTFPNSKKVVPIASGNIFTLTKGYDTESQYKDAFKKV